METFSATSPAQIETGGPEESQTSPHHSLDHQRKRLSFFGRSSSEVAAHKRTISSLDAAMPPSKGRSDPVNTPASRSSTALTQNRRKKHDPLDSIRKSLLGLGTRMKAPANDQVNPPRPGSSRKSLSRHSQVVEQADTSLIPFATPSTKKKDSTAPQFNNEEQCTYRPVICS